MVYFNVFGLFLFILYNRATQLKIFFCFGHCLLNCHQTSALSPWSVLFCLFAGSCFFLQSESCHPRPIVCGEVLRSVAEQVILRRHLLPAAKDLSKLELASQTQHPDGYYMLLNGVRGVQQASPFGPLFCSLSLQEMLVEIRPLFDDAKRHGGEDFFRFFRLLKFLRCMFGFRRGNELAP